MEIALEMTNSKANQSDEVGTTEDPVFKYWYEYYARQGELLYHYGFPIFLFIGLVGNILSVILITRGTFKRMSIGVYLLFLSISDLCICGMGIANWLPEATLGFLISNHEAVCKATQYFSKVFEETSSWMIVAITMERAVVVILPHQTWLKTSRTKAWLISAAIVTVLALINIYQPFIVGIVEDGECFFVDHINNNLSGVGMLVTVNHSINIFLYFLMFRHEFWRILKCCKSSQATVKDNETKDHYSVSTVM